MMEQINRFRRDPRMVAPLTLIAILVVGYALKQALGGPGPTRVAVHEVTPQPTRSVTIPTPVVAQSEDGRNPYFHPALLRSKSSDGTHQSAIEGDLLQSVLPSRQPVAPAQPSSALQPVLPTAPVGSSHRHVPDDPEAANRSSIAPTPEPVVPKAPSYRLSAVLLGSEPTALVVLETGETLRVSLFDQLPTGEVVSRITRTYVALESATAARLVYLLDSRPRGNDNSPGGAP